MDDRARTTKGRARLSALARKSARSDSGRRFDYVVSLCDKVRDVCPELPGHPRRLHWSIPDPATADHTNYPAFQRTATEIDTRIRHLLPVLTATHS